jgi:hypothetical protein
MLDERLHLNDRKHALNALNARQPAQWMNQISVTSSSLDTLRW